MFCNGASWVYASASTSSPSATAVSPAATSTPTAPLVGGWEVSLLHDLLDSWLNLCTESLDELRSDIVCCQMMELAGGHESWTMSC